MIITLEHYDGQIESVEDSKWRTYSAAFNWNNISKAFIKFDNNAFSVMFDPNALTHCIILNLRQRILPTEEVIPTLRLALSCAILRNTPFNGFVHPN